MTEDRWYTADDDCPRCGGLMEQYCDDQDLVLAERCTKCKWQVNFDRDEEGRKVRYGAPVEVLR